MSQRFPVAVLVSGSGSNLQAILDAADDPEYPAKVAVVVADRPGIRALERARQAGVSTEVVAWADHRDRSTFTGAICERVATYGARAMVLAGFLRILGVEAVERFPNAILNIHPSLLPAFPGTIRAVDEALEHGVKVTGVTVHFVDENVDTGPIIAQEAVPVLPEDDAAALHKRLQRVEHRLYPDAVAALAEARLVVNGTHVEWKGQ